MLSIRINDLPAGAVRKSAWKIAAVAVLANDFLGFRTLFSCGLGLSVASHGGAHVYVAADCASARWPSKKLFLARYSDPASGTNVDYRSHALVVFLAKRLGA